jgi:hypothetical protein
MKGFSNHTVIHTCDTLVLLLGVGTMSGVEAAAEEVLAPSLFGGAKIKSMKKSYAKVGYRNKCMDGGFGGCENSVSLPPPPSFPPPSLLPSLPPFGV